MKEAARPPALEERDPLKEAAKPPVLEERFPAKEAARPPGYEGRMPPRGVARPTMMMGAVWRPEDVRTPQDRNYGSGPTGRSQGPPRGSENPGETAGERQEPSDKDTTVTIMLKPMEGMQALQKQMLDSRDEESGAGGAEAVRAARQLPGLPTWAL